MSKLVTSIDGEIINRNFCRKVNGAYYIKNKDVFEINGKWHRADTNKFIIDHATGRPATKITKIAVVKIKNGLPFIGATSDLSNLVEIKGEGTSYVCLSLRKTFHTIDGKTQNNEILPCLNIDLAKELGYIFAGNNYMEKKTKIDKNTFCPTAERVNYGVGNRINDSVETYLNYRKRTTSKQSKDLAKIFGRYTFGLEFETASGVLPDYYCERLGLMKTKDGSLRTPAGLPFEYVTIPLQGSNGFENLKNVTKNLDTFCTVSEKCSLHVHIGGYPKDKQSLVSIYHLCRVLQNEIFEMFPPYKRNGLDGRKSYSSPIPKLYNPILVKNYTAENYQDYIRDSYDELYRYVSCGKTLNETHRATMDNHPMARNKWHINSRYHWVNFVPIMFSPYGTIEFRIHTPTHNFQKIYSWMLLISAILKYAERHPKKVLESRVGEITLNDVIQELERKKATLATKNLSKRVIEYLSRYILHRKEYFSIFEPDDPCLAELKEDSNWKLT